MAIKIISRCRQCIIEDSPITAVSIGEYGNKEYHELNCITGKHKTKFFHAVPDYGIFFQNGLYAYHKEEYFEAFTSIYHSYELFKMTFIESSLITLFNFSYREIIDYTKPIRKNSVQIDGAFNILYSAKYKKAVPDLPNSLKKIRNTIIHGSHYPQKEDVVKEIKDVYDFIFNIEQLLITRTEYPFSEFQCLGDARLKYLQKQQILTREDFDKGYSDVMTDNSNILGRYPLKDTPDYTNIFTFEDILESSRAQLEILENTKNIFKNHEQ